MIFNRLNNRSRGLLNGFGQYLQNIKFHYGFDKVMTPQISDYLDALHDHHAFVEGLEKLNIEQLKERARHSIDAYLAANESIPEEKLDEIIQKRRDRLVQMNLPILQINYLFQEILKSENSLPIRSKPIAELEQIISNFDRQLEKLAQNGLADEHQSILKDLASFWQEMTNGYFDVHRLQIQITRTERLFESSPSAPSDSWMVCDLNNQLKLELEPGYEYMQLQAARLVWKHMHFQMSTQDSTGEDSYEKIAQAWVGSETIQEEIEEHCLKVEALTDRGSRLEEILDDDAQKSGLIGYFTNLPLLLKELSTQQGVNDIDTELADIFTVCKEVVTTLSDQGLLRKNAFELQYKLSGLEASMKAIRRKSYSVVHPIKSQVASRALDYQRQTWGFVTTAENAFEILLSQIKSDVKKESTQ